ncbi:hypothetical protein AAC387_Pa02g3093 [Persea americana]
MDLKVIFLHVVVVVSEVDNPQWSNRLMLAKKGLGAEEVAYSVIKEPVPSGPEPWGGDGGRPWDDGVFSGIKQISLQGDKQLLQYSLSMTEMGNLFGLPNMELAVERPHIR